MKLTDLFIQIETIRRGATNWVRYPGQIISQHVRNVAQEQIEQAEVQWPQRRASPSEQSPSPNTNQPQTSAPLSVQPKIEEVADGEAGLAQDEGLNPKTFTGRRGKYELDKKPFKKNPVKLYRGRWVWNQVPVLVQEFLLDRFDRDQLREAQKILELLESVSLRNSAGHNFRLLTPWDTAIATAEKRGYLITQYDPDKYRTLQDYLEPGIPMPPQQVRQVLLQVLQTLWFLHNHPIRFTDGTVQYGLLHGNLNLNSLLIVSDPHHISGQEQKFFIYITGLELWHIPFQLSTQKGTSFTFTPFEALQPKFYKKDLTDLGAVGLSLLTADRYKQPANFNPSTNGRRQESIDAYLTEFIDRLSGRTGNPFSSAEEAYRELLNPVQKAPSQPQTTPSAATSPEPSRVPGYLWLLLLALLLLGFGSWWLWRSLTGQPPLRLARPPAPTAVRDVSALKKLPANPINFAVSEGWRSVIGLRRSSFDNSLLRELNQRSNHHALFQFRPRMASSSPLVLQQMLRSGRLAFVLSDSTSGLSGEDLEQTTVAYDGVAVVVAFSDAYRAKNIPNQLDGEISLHQLQKIYVGDNSSFYPLLPKDPVAITRFRKTLFPDASERGGYLIEQFKSLIDARSQLVNTMFETILKSFEDNSQVTSIGFARISQVYGQCSVYPLAIVASGQSIQPFIQDNGKPINPELDLCNTKGGYWADPTVFANGQYPFTYQLTVVYPKINVQSKQAAEAFIAALTTDEGQCLLSEAGLVPLSPVREKGLCRGINAP